MDRPLEMEASLASEDDDGILAPAPSAQVKNFAGGLSALERQMSEVVRRAVQVARQRGSLPDVPEDEGEKRTYLQHPELLAIDERLALLHDPDKMMLQADDMHKFTDLTKSKAMDAETDSEFHNYLIAEIQSAIRCWLCRSRFLLMRGAAIYIQQYWRKWHAERVRYAQESNAAARRIQTTWRRVRDRRIFAFYRDLIVTRERGDPGVLLRGINPLEAGLADAAAGVHVRFRLGGSTFPPLIFYKIYTGRPVADVGSFAPRDYVAERSDEKSARTAKVLAGKMGAPLPNAVLGVGNAGVAGRPRDKARRKAGGASQGGGERGEFELDEQLIEYVRPDGTFGRRPARNWYRRVENNGWRPVADRLLVDAEAEERARESAKTLHHSHLPKLRREDAARRAKERKRQWLRAMYNMTTQSAAPSKKSSARHTPDNAEGALFWAGTRQGAIGDPPLPGTPEGGSRAQNLDPFERFELGRGEDPLEDPEMEHMLLKWAGALDFDEYKKSWGDTALTSTADAFLVETRNLGVMRIADLDAVDPIAIDLDRRAASPSPRPTSAVSSHFPSTPTPPGSRFVTSRQMWDTARTPGREPSLDDVDTARSRASAVMVIRRELSEDQSGQSAGDVRRPVAEAQPHRKSVKWGENQVKQLPGAATAKAPQGVAQKQQQQQQQQAAMSPWSPASSARPSVDMGSQRPPDAVVDLAQGMQLSGIGGWSNQNSPARGLGGQDSEGALAQAGGYL
ncbi:unnamed protein product [Pedinophyceae sp. YPF-701]|nr:unnamed protein product [Pedinophyceae sp. YPF-701]